MTDSFLFVALQPLCGGVDVDTEKETNKIERWNPQNLGNIFENNILDNGKVLPACEHDSPESLVRGLLSFHESLSLNQPQTQHVDVGLHR